MVKQLRQIQESGFPTPGFGTQPTNTPDSQNPSSSGSEGAPPSAIIIALIAVSLLVTATFFTYILLRRLRVKGHTPKFIPTTFLKRKWQQWQPEGKYASVNATERGDTLPVTSTEYRNRGGTTATNAAAAGIDRNASIRSIMSLPAYSQTPKETEQVLGREGERGGMDTVVEFPETAEEEEAVRDTEMESLFQIREARRREIAEREERRQERREARDRGDWQRLEELRRESRQRSQATRAGPNDNPTAELLIAEHQSRPRDRRISSVAYADVGQVRHDGTRVRANSHESERGGLLDGAAPMGETLHNRNPSEAGSLLTLENLSRPSLAYTGGRHRSDSGALSVSTISSNEMPQSTPTRTDEVSHRTHVSSGHPHSTSASASTSDDSPAASRYTPPGTDGESDGNDTIDLGTFPTVRASTDISQPPNYEQIDWGAAPAYTEEEIRRRESQRTARLGVPTIHVQLPSEPNSPALPQVFRN